MALYTLTSFSNLRIPFSSILMSGIEDRLFGTFDTGSSVLCEYGCVLAREDLGLCLLHP